MLYHFETKLLHTVLTLTYIELLCLSIFSFASKTAQIQWLILTILICWLHQSKYEEIFFDFYWYSIFCIGSALGTIFLFSRKLYSAYLRPLFINVFGSFISIFDIGTDIVIIVLWISGGLYFWVILQLIFIFGGTIYSAFYIDDYYFIAKGYESKENNDKHSTEICDNPIRKLNMLNSRKDREIEKIERNKEKAKRLFWGRFFTLLGLGRLYHGIVGWDENKNKDMEISNRILKVWEMCFESFPTITLQTYISLYTNLNINIVLSVLVSFASISFTFFRVLYGDHFSKNRKQEQIIAKRVERKHRVSTISATLDFTLNQLFMANGGKHKSKNKRKHSHGHQPSVPSFNAPRPMITMHQHNTTNSTDFGEELEMKVLSPKVALYSKSLRIVDEVDQLAMPDMTPNISTSASALDFCHDTVASFIKLGYDEDDVQRAYNRLKTNEKHCVVRDITVDDIEFQPVLLNILENEMKCQPKSRERLPDRHMKRRRSSTLSMNLDRAASMLETSDTMDGLWRNFICCIPVKLLVDCSKNTEDEDQDNVTPRENKQDNNSRFECMDKLFYLVIYAWVMTDFFCRIFPVLACSHLRHSYLEGLEVAVLLGLFEFVMYYFMLSGEFKTPRAASSFFWTLFMTISYCLLSTMHIVHLPNNVIFDRLIIEHLVRMVIQCGFMIFAMVIQYYEYDDVLGYFKYSIIFFWCTLFINLILTGIVKWRMKGFKEKIVKMNEDKNGNGNDKLNDNDEYYRNDIGHHRHNNGLFMKTSNDTIESIANSDLVRIVPLKDSDEDQCSYSDCCEESDDTLELRDILNEDLSNDTIANSNEINPNYPIYMSDSEAP